MTLDKEQRCVRFSVCFIIQHSFASIFLFLLHWFGLHQRPLTFSSMLAACLPLFYQPHCALYYSCIVVWWTSLPLSCSDQITKTLLYKMDHKNSAVVADDAAERKVSKMDPLLTDLKFSGYVLQIYVQRNLRNLLVIHVILAPLCFCRAADSYGNTWRSKQLEIFSIIYSTWHFAH